MVSTSERRTLSVEECARILGLGRSATYEAVRAGQIPSIRIGGRWLIPAAALEKLLECRQGRETSQG